MPLIDVKWFQDRIRDLGLSQRRVSKLLERSPNTLSLILTGHRRVSHKELPRLAQFLDTTPDELLKRLGAETPGTVRDGDVEIIGTVDEMDRITPETAARRVAAPSQFRLTRTLRAVVFETAGTGHDWMHGWALFYEQPARPRAVDADTLGRLCVVEVGDKPGAYVCAIRRGIERGRYDLLHAFRGDLMVGGVVVRSAAPVLWIRTEGQ
ncbi:MAG: helix-turn-helix transcriptional regulator [Hyphomicrobiales bacterium]|nr:helix-turn-helix transcriptional regulator [Hyphomicrobiales bacterium]